MQDDFEIGRVVAVDTAQVTIELNADLKALTRATYEGAQDIGRINSYIILPVGARRLVAMITRVFLTEEAEVSSDRTMVTLPSARRRMKATLIGTIVGDAFTQGVSLFPILDNPVHLVTARDLGAIFDRAHETSKEVQHPENPSFCIHVGDSPIFEGFPIQINPDIFFGKHAAIIGSTGSGKSCTVATILQGILERPEINRTNVVILDTNGEYRSAFQKQNPDGTWENFGQSSILFIPSDPKRRDESLVIPYWFMNADDFVRLYQASQRTQGPVLLEALRLARNEASGETNTEGLREQLIRELNHIWALAGRDDKTSREVRDTADGVLRLLASPELASAWQNISKMHADLAKDNIVKAIAAVKAEAEKHIDIDRKDSATSYPKRLPADAQGKIRTEIGPIYSHLTGSDLGKMSPRLGVSADTPRFFDKRRFLSMHVEQVLRREESGGARARDYSGTMLLRINRLMEDHRFEFLFGPTDGKFPRATQILATFFRDILGLPSQETPSPPLSDTEAVPPGTLPFYDRQRATTEGHHIAILDLSLLAAEVLENVTALVGRLILEFLQRLGEYGDGSRRGSLPIVLVLEEAQNYIREQRGVEDESISRLVFERIAREGRKYGLGLVVASQRPSELSKTVLSQCSSFIVHRLQNPEDLRYFKEIVPSVYAPLLDQLPALAPQTALILGECVRAPALVKIREATPIPRSRDPKFYKYWVDKSPPNVPVEDICKAWDLESNEEKSKPPNATGPSNSAV